MSNKFLNISFILFFQFIYLNAISGTNFPEKNETLKNCEIAKEDCFSNIKFGFHNDSIHKLNFRYADKKRGLKPYIAPAILISAGTALHFSTDAKENFQDWVQSKFTYSGDVDDYIQYAPLVAVYSLNIFGVKGKNNFGNSTAIAIKSILLNDFIVNSLKTWTDETRPNGDARSFPSGHTSLAFAMAHFMHKEFGELTQLDFVKSATLVCQSAYLF